MENITQDFIAQSISYIELNPPRIENCLNRLTEEQVWDKPNENANSIANLILHLCGNITQYIVSSLGENADQRQRDLEFSTAGGYSKAELLAKIKRVTAEAVEVIRTQDSESLIQMRKVQGFDLSGVAIVVHVTEHYSYHVGQIALLTKLLCGQDLGFYAGLDLNEKNESGE